MTASVAPRSTSPTAAPRRAGAPAGRSRAARGPVVASPTGASRQPGGGIALKLGGPAAKDPRYLKVMTKLQQSAARTRQHPAPSLKASQAQAAALGPANEKVAGAKASKTDAMGDAPTSKPDADGFLALLRAEIQKVIPKKVEGTKTFLKGEDKQQLKGAMTGNIEQQKQASAGDMKGAAAQPLDTGAVAAKAVTPLAAEPAPGAPPAVGAADAMPAPKSEADVSLQSGKQEADRALTDNKLTTPQLEEANDPRFSRVVTAKAEVDSKSTSLPQQYRGSEQKVIAAAANKAVADEGKSLAAFRAQKGKAAGEVRQRQLTAKEKDELERKKVTDTIEAIFNRTKAAVDLKLASLDDEVGRVFDQGTEAALQRMRDYVERKFDDRYGGVIGKGRWLKDKIWPLPDSVKKWFDEARQVFLDELDRLVVRVAGLVETRLREAKALITQGQKEIANYVASLPASLQNVGRSAEQEMAGRFDEMRAAVDDKKNDLAGKLAMRYKEALDKGDAALKEIRDAHKSLVERVKEFVAEVVEVLRNFKNRVLGMLRKAASVADLIVSSPIRFLKNLLAAIKQGMQQFKDRILEHLQRALLSWLFGNLKDSGVTLPKDLSLPSILLLVLQVLGLTYDRIRAKAVKLIGERNVALLEKVWEILRLLWTGGPAALWEKMKEYLADLKARVMDEVQNWVITTIIKAALTKLAMMFNPVGAIIQAILTIYKVVTFFIERINQILDFVEAIVDSVVDIATGAIGKAANWIEQALGRGLALLISFLASFLGLGGITDKVKSIIKKVQGAVDKALDKVIEKVVAGIGKLVGAGKQAVAALAQWWKARKAFKQGGETHELSFDGEGESARLVVSSTPRTLEAYLTKVKQGKLSNAQKAKVGSIEVEVQKIQEIKKRTKGGFGQGAGQEIQQSLAAIAQLLSTEPFLDLETAAPPVTAVKFGKRTIKVPGLGQSEVGEEMVAEPLSINPGGLAGSQPFEETPLWLEVNRRSYTYVRGHLLNHHVHGPGANYNMVPITRSVNRRMESQAESTVKRAVLSENKVVKYRVKATFPSSPIKRRLEAEGYLPTEVTMQAWEMKKEKNKWVVSSTEVLKPVSLPHELPPDKDV